MACSYDRVSRADTQLPPIVGELEAIFRELPDEELLNKLRGPRRRGRPGFDPESLWRCYVAYYYLGLESVSALIRYLEDNPFVAQACRINSPDEIPSQPTFSRFGTKLTGRWIALEVKNILRDLTRKLYDTLPDFGKSVAIDGTDIKAWSNGVKKARNESQMGRSVRNQRSGRFLTLTLGGASKPTLRATKSTSLVTKSISSATPPTSCPSWWTPARAIFTTSTKPHRT
jgi:transposase